MRKQLTTSAIAIVLCTLILGFAYPLAITGISQLAFPHTANGSTVEVNGNLVGSSLIGQDFRKPDLDRGGKPRVDADGEPILVADPIYFQSRPSATGYSANVTFFNNLGPNNRELSQFFADGIAAYLKLEGPYTPGLTVDGVPVDAVTTSASGVDPHISEANARIQANRIASVRRIPVSRVLELVDANTDDRSLAIFGEPGVNVLELNIALDKEAPVR